MTPSNSLSRRGGVNDPTPARWPTRDELARGIAVYVTLFRSGIATLVSIIQCASVADARRRYPVLTQGLDDNEVLILNDWLWHPPSSD